MNNFKRILALMVVLCMGLCLCACGGGTDTTGSTQGTQPSGTEPTGSQPTGTEPTGTEPSSSVSDGKVDYKVTVVDPEGNPVAGVYVQICLEDLCYNPAATNEEGVATFRLNPQEGYKTKLAMKLDGYVWEDYIYFAEGAYEITITLVAEG